ncbi:MAG: ABC transporter permease, partial [Bacteroidota bacterium]
MLKNYFLVALRNLSKNSAYSTINISGLSIGLICSILIALWVIDENTYDHFIPKRDRLQQVWVSAFYDSKVNSWNSVPLPTYEAMKTANSHIVNSVVTDWGSDHLLTVGEKRIYQRGYYVSEEFLEMFEFPLLHGDASQVLDEPTSIVISESAAKALFGDEDPMNKIIKIDNDDDLKVSGVLKDVPGNSSFDFDILIPWSYRRKVNEWVRDNEDNWGNYSFQVFVELDDKTKFNQAEAGIKDMLEENKDDDDEMESSFFLYPMERWRLYSSFENGIEKGGLIEYVQLFTAIAILIVVIACINFMNLATARSQKRSKEVGIRKTVGSKRNELVVQFLTEAIVIAFISYIIAIILVLLLLPFYNDLVEKQLNLEFNNGTFWLASVAIIFITGLLAGSYPAFYLSSFSPASILKGKGAIGDNANLPRKILVILQFCVAIILIVGTIVIYQQIEMARSRDLGYKQERLITVDFTEELRKSYDVFKNDLLNSGFVESVTRSNSSITSVNSNNFIGWPGKPEDLRVLFVTVSAHYDYAETMGIEVLHGRDFSKDYASDSLGILINKAALDLMDLEEPIAGTELELWGSKRNLVGVLDNVLMESPYEEVRPLFVILDDWGGVVTIRLRSGQELQASLGGVENVFKKYNPAYPFDYEFMDADFEKKFTYIKLTQTLANMYALLALIITGLGILGLAAFTAEQRKKEIGIRKVLGATISQLVGMISKDFTKLILIAFFLAAPTSWWLLSSYLERYTLRIDIAWWVFPVAGLAALIFALIIVANQAFRAAASNPVKS